MNAPLLELAGFGVAFGKRVVLASIDLELAERGLTTLMGPVGVGKSTLLRTLAGRNDAEPTLRTWGRARYLGARWPSTTPPALVGQGARQLVATVLESIASALPERSSLQRGEQRRRVLDVLAGLGFHDLGARLDEPVIELGKLDLRRVSLAVALAGDPPLLLADEPTAGLGEPERAIVLDVLRRRAERRAVLLVTHSRADALALPGHTALLAGGSIVERGETRALFAAPRSPITQGFVETGSCAVASPPTLDELVADGLLDRAFLAAIERPAGGEPARAHALLEPSLAIRWLEPGKLAGVRRPGLFGAVDRDLQALADAGVKLLVCLEESSVLSPEILARYGLSGHASPVVDMDAPSIEEALALCEIIEESITAGAPVAVHCRAGLGRTGTALCSYLLRQGLEFERALARLRAVEPRFVQSERQLDFLASFSAHLRASALRPLASSPH